MKKLYSIIALVLVGIGVSAQCTITSGPTVTQNGSNVSVTGTGTGATFPQYIYDWGDMTNPGTTQTSTHTYTSAGTYQLCMYYVDLTDTSCSDVACTPVVITAVGINDHSVAAVNIAAVPNPFNSEVTINLTLAKSEMVDVAVFDMTGKQVASLKNGLTAAGTTVLEWKPAGLSAGVYFVQVRTGNAVITKKIVYTAS